ncbi:MAG: hypothetical protein IPG90_04630 [Bacteroidetes bacterium]|nr:hypothetical protein [Bacteroidota bacterium]
MKSSFRLLVFGIGMNLLCFVSSLSAKAVPDDVTVFAKIDTTQIRIGEQIKLNLTASAPPGAKFKFPLIPDTMNGLEFVNRSGIDTLKSENGKNIIYSQSVKVTAFDSGFFVLEPFHFLLLKDNQLPDTLSTEALLISVRTIPVDTTKEIKDIKATMDVPISWKEILVYVIAALVLILLVFFIIREIRRRRKMPKPEVKIVVPVIPPHILALEALKKTMEEKLWQQGLYKQYHSSVSDTLRAYIEGRFEINALELTTDETMSRFRGNMLREDARQKLFGILQLADMVKFAKVIPIGSENEQSMTDAVQFVMLTKPAEESDFKELEVKQ